MTTAIYPGTFDPVTNGHLDIVRRGAALFSRVIVAVGVRSEKKTLFPTDERVALLRESLPGLGNVEVEPFQGLIVEFARAHQATVLLRGVRNATDYAYETQMAVTNRHLAQEIDTVFLAADPRVGFVSSTLVKEILGAGGKIDDFVPPPVAAALGKRG